MLSDKNLRGKSVSRTVRGSLLILANTTAACCDDMAGERHCGLANKGRADADIGAGFGEHHTRFWRAWRGWRGCCLARLLFVSIFAPIFSLSKTVTNYKNSQPVQQGSDPFGQVFAILTARQHKALQKFSFRKSVTYAIISK